VAAVEDTAVAVAHEEAVVDTTETTRRSATRDIIYYIIIYVLSKQEPFYLHKPLRACVPRLIFARRAR
jgi:hypothetical protein